MPFRILEELYATSSRNYTLTKDPIYSKVAQNWNYVLATGAFKKKLLIVKEKKREWEQCPIQPLIQ